MTYYADYSSPSFTPYRPIVWLSLDRDTHRLSVTPRLHPRADELHENRPAALLPLLAT